MISETFPASSSKMVSKNLVPHQEKCWEESRYQSEARLIPLMHNVPKWSDTLLQDFKVCLNIWGHALLS